MFFFKGLLMTGPKHNCINSGCVIFLIATFSAFYFICILPTLIKAYGYALPIINVLALLVAITFLLLTMFTDPGIIPRKSVWEI